jgi:hypothetical protein
VPWLFPCRDRYVDIHGYRHVHNDLHDHEPLTGGRLTLLTPPDLSD